MTAVSRGFLRALFSWPTLTLAVCLVAITAYGTLVTWAGLDISAWIVLLGSLTSSQSIIVLAFLWWIVTLMRIANRSTNELVLVRYGSRLHVLRGALGEAVGELMAAGAVIAVTTTAAAPWHWDLAWAAPNIYPALQAAFSSPLVALFAATVYAASAFLLLAVVGLSIALTVGSRWTLGCLLVIYVWAALSAFGVTNALSAIDISRAFTLVWAISTGSGPLPLVLLGLAAAGSVVAVGARDGGGNWRQLVLSASKRIVLWPSALSFAIALTVFSGSGSIAVDQALSAFFVGDNGDVVMYFAAMVPILAGATFAFAPAVAAAGERFEEEAIRDGSALRWVVRRFASCLVRAALMGVCIVCAVLIAAVIARPEAPSISWVTPAAFFAARVALQVTLYSAIGFVLLWFTPIAVTWPIALVGALALGYPFIYSLGTLNVFAAFASNPASPGSPLDWSRNGVLLLAFTLTIGALLIGAARNRTPHSSLKQIAG